MGGVGAGVLSTAVVLLTPTSVVPCASMRLCKRSRSQELDPMSFRSVGNLMCTLKGSYASRQVQEPKVV